MYEIDEKEQLFLNLVDIATISVYTTSHIARPHTSAKEEAMAVHEAPVPWNEKVDQIQYSGDAINIFPEKMSFSCALGHVRAMRGMILTVRYKTHKDVCMTSDPPYEERFLVTLANVHSDGKKGFALIKTYRWIITEINMIPTARDASEGLPTFNPVLDQDIWKKLTALLINKDGLLRPHTQLIQSSSS